MIKRAQGAHPHVRRTLFWCHFVVGLTIGLIVAFLAITGSIMAFQDRVIAFAERRVQVQPVREATCLSVEPGLEAVRAQTAQMPATVQVFADSARPSLMTLPRGEPFWWMLAADMCLHQAHAGESSSRTTRTWTAGSHFLEASMRVCARVRTQPSSQFCSWC